MNCFPKPRSCQSKKTGVNVNGATTLEKSYVSC